MNISHYINDIVYIILFGGIGFVITLVMIIFVIIICYTFKKLYSKFFNKEKLLINKYLKSKKQEDGRRALLYLIKFSTFKKVENFIKEGIDLNYTDKNGNTILIEVATDKRVELSEYLNQTIEVTEIVNGKEITVKKGNSFIQILINNGADINIKNNQGNTALIEAAKQGNYHIVKTLINNDADTKTLPNDMALILACEEGNIDKAKSLIQRGANVNFSTNYEKKTPLMFACENYTFPIIKLLIEYSADINAKEISYDWTPLYYAIISDTINKKNNGSINKMEIIKYLISKGANINEDIPIYLNHETIKNYSILMHACDHNDVYVVKILLENGAKVNTKNSRGTTALHRAKQTGNTELIELLKSYGTK